MGIHVLSSVLALGVSDEHASLGLGGKGSGRAGAKASVHSVWQPLFSVTAL